VIEIEIMLRRQPTAREAGAPPSRAVTMRVLGSDGREVHAAGRGGTEDLHGGGQGRLGGLTSMLLTPRPFSATMRKSPFWAVPLLRIQS
jgi:hypothetical protein